MTIKKTYHFIPLLFAALLLCSCTSIQERRNTQKAIKNNAYHYVDAMANYRIDDAEPYCTQETRDGVLTTGRRLMAAVTPGYIESDTPATVTIEKVELTSDTTAIVSYHKITPIKDMRGDVPLVLRDGEWLVHIILKSSNNNEERPVLTHDTINGREVIGFKKQ